MIELARQYGRYGYRKIAALLRDAGRLVSDTRVERVWRRGPDGERPRQAEKVVALRRRAWRVVHRLHPAKFDRDVPNPWDGVTMKRRAKNKKKAVTRAQVYTFAWGAVERGRPETAAAAVICFEWLQRPENVLAEG